MTEQEKRKLIAAAKTASQNSYSPYSNYKVGAAILLQDDQIYSGCNIENISFGATICAERTALAKAVSERHTAFKAIAIYAENKEGIAEYAFPCGICRQVLAEFAAEDLTVLIAKSETDYLQRTLADLLPEHFVSKSL